MQDRPTAHELIDTVAVFLEREIVPTITDARLRFRALVAANLLAIVGREMRMGDEQLRAEWVRLKGLLDASVTGEKVQAEVEMMTRELCARIRAGEADDGEFQAAVFDHVEQTVIEKLRIANPKFLERVNKESNPPRT